MTRRPSAAAFILLEVMLALMILAVAMTAVIRGFVYSMNAIRENRITETATLLAQSLLDDYELEPPEDGSANGKFADDDRFGEAFAAYSWEREVEEEEVDYESIPKDPLQEMEPLYVMKLRILYDDGVHRQFVPISLTTNLLDTQLFSDEAIQANQLF